MKAGSDGSNRAHLESTTHWRLESRQNPHAGKRALREPIAELRNAQEIFERGTTHSDQIYMPTALHDLWQHLQRQLFPTLLDELGGLGERDQHFVQVISLLPLGPFLPRYRWKGIGCPPHERVWLLHAFIAKAVYGFATTELLLDALRTRPTLRRLCGWETLSDIPSNSTFSRAFAQFAGDQLPQQIHEALVKIHCGPKLAGHVSRDSTAIEVRERPAPKNKPEPEPAPRRKIGRPKKGEVREPAPLTKIERQATRSLPENLADLPRDCAFGRKAGSKGYFEIWVGYKLHLDVIDGDIPVSALLTSASVHDSQAAIPLAQMTAQRLTSLYDLMDCAYDAPTIRQFSRDLGHVPLIEPHPQRSAPVLLDPAQRLRFRERTASERVNSRLKDHYGGRTVRVRGAVKVMAHLMFGVLVVSALALWARLC